MTIGELSPGVIGRLPPAPPSAAAVEELWDAGPATDPRRKGTGQALPDALRPRPIGEAGGTRPAATAAAPAEIAAGAAAAARWLASGVPGRGGAVDLGRVMLAFRLAGALRRAQRGGGGGCPAGLGLG